MNKYTFKDIPVCFPWGSDHLEVTNGILDLMNHAYNEGYEKGKEDACHQANVAIDLAYQKDLKKEE